MLSGFQKNIKMLRELRGIRQEDLAEAMGVSMTTIWKWESGQAQPRAKYIRMICERYGVTEDDLLSASTGLYAKAVGLSEQVVPAPADTFAPVLGTIAAGEPREAIAQAGETRWVRPDLLERYPDCFFLRVSGSSMDRVLPDGCYALIAPGEVRSGDVAAVKVNGEEACVKRVWVSEELHLVKLSPESTDTKWRTRVIDGEDPDAPEVRLLGRVVWYSGDM